MPAYKGALSSDQIDDLAAFLSTAMMAERTINVDITAQRAALSRSTIEIGTVSFDIHNGAKTSYRFTIAGKSTPEVAPGTTTDLVVDLADAARYSYGLTAPSQGSNALKGTLIVTAAKTTPKTTTPRNNHLPDNHDSGYHSRDDNDSGGPSLQWAES